MQKTAVINVVGLSPKELAKGRGLFQDIARRRDYRPIMPPLPAVTTTSQYTYLTGKLPAEHGIVGNGWLFRDEQEIKLWRQSHHLVQAPTLWETLQAQDPQFTVSQMFWWYNMYSSAQFSCTPRPQYRADGPKIPDIYTQPMGLRDALQRALGPFPLFKFWGPFTSIEASVWIAKAAIMVDQWYDPGLSLIYLPHLDYNLQRLPHDHPRIAQDVHQVEQCVENLYRHFSDQGARVVVLSEYGITPVSGPVHINRALRKKGWLNWRVENGREVLIPGACSAVALCDHQIAHVYAKPELVPEVKTYLQQVEGIAEVLDKEEQIRYGLHHERSGELVAIAAKDRWFSYYYWKEDERAPDFARTVDIHRKPGYDPVELFTDPKIPFPKTAATRRVLQKKLGFRYLMDLIPLNAGLVRGSHGRLPQSEEEGPLLWSSWGGNPKGSGPLQATDVYEVLRKHLQD